ncbi:MBL fold metallo-hydrolase [Candidatus Marsarchaeota archaeon]|jgi:putative mRNA 3-end processing factor|nr:MBL fold metallo-hydrolase [Candidatus Marsarchaeota archaeon]
MMELRFFGGAQEVGRSAIMLKDDRNIMLDFGIKIDHKTEYPINIPKLDALVVSHAHLDHSGFSPAIYNESSIPTFGTLPTLSLSKLLLEDALNIARKQHAKPRFHKRQIMAYASKYVSLDYKSTAHFGNYDITMYDAGHISGSAITLVEKAHEHGNRRIVYTGDFKLKGQVQHNGATIVKSDVLITESTYASKVHPDRDGVIKSLLAGINEVLDNGGNALLPVFAVGRSQEILSVLQQNGLAPSTFVDGMAREATSIVLNYPKFISSPKILSEAMRESRFIRDQSERREALSGPSIIVTTAGMLNGGPVLNYITKLNKNSKIFLTGYQVEGTNGRLLMDHGYINLDGEKTRITAPVGFYDLSAHADVDDIMKYVHQSAPNKVVCVHGSRENAEALSESLRGEGFDAIAPKVGDSVKID